MRYVLSFLGVFGFQSAQRILRYPNKRLSSSYVSISRISYLTLPSLPRRQNSHTALRLSSLDVVSKYSRHPSKSCLSLKNLRSHSFLI